MLRLLVISVLMLRFSPLLGQQDIKQVDFKNFSYPISGHLLGHSSLEWLDTTAQPAPNRQTVHLIGGVQLKKISSVVVDGTDYGQYEGFTLQSVRYGDVIGDGKEEAIVSLLWQSGGTQTTNYVYIYGFGVHGPMLLAYCHTGSRAHSGLYGASARQGLLVFELFDPARSSGDCCSSRVLISSYKWANGAFRLVGPVKSQALAPLKEHSD